MRAALAGFFALAAAMGIGRFAFTPVLPLMQQQLGLSLADGGVLGAANYAGYLLGAVACVVWRPRPVALTRAGLVAVAGLTAAMAVPTGYPAWLLLRFGAGVASAGVFVGVSALTVASGSYAGVGAGIAAAGLLVLAVSGVGGSAAAAWIALGALAVLLAAAAWRALRVSPAEVPSGASTPLAPPVRGSLAASRRLVVCYGALGLGYVLPATFLPAAARARAPDPAIFGWAWPIFGVTAAVSTAASVPLLRRLGALRVWALAQTVMAAGLLVPVLSPGLPAIAVTAVTVGGTFLVVTMAGMRAARELAPGSTRLVAAMTTAFAAGQLVGPLLVRGEDLTGPSILAGAVLLSTAAAVVLAPRASDLRAPR